MAGPRIAVDVRGLDHAAPRGPARYAYRLLEELEAHAGDRIVRWEDGATAAAADVVVALGARPRITRTPPVVSAVYDLTHLLAPRSLTPIERARRGFATAWVVHQSAHLLAPSLSIAAALDTYLRVPAGRLTWLPTIGPDWRRPPRGDVESERAAIGLENPYLVFVGTLERRKNLSTLVGAWERANAAAGRLDLVICGAGDPAPAGVPDRAGIHWLGYVADERLRRLVAGATAWVSPSRAEGCAIGAIEAMTLGAPAIVAAGTALAEVVGSAGIVVAADDVEGWTAALTHVATDTSDRNRMAARGLVAARELRTADAAGRILRAAEAAVQTTAGPRAGR